LKNADEAMKQMKLPFVVCMRQRQRQWHDGVTKESGTSFSRYHSHPYRYSLCISSLLAEKRTSPGFSHTPTASAAAYSGF
jgi:hypothetical protein